MIDPTRAWRTRRLDVEPLVAAHAVELADGLDDPGLHEFIGGSPLAADALAQRFERLESRHSPDGDQVWANWALRERETGRAIGTLQATLPAGGPSAGPAEVAWVVIRAAQGRGFATEAAASLVASLRDEGWDAVAHIHPEHAASKAVARAAGLAETDRLVNGEVRWATPPRSRTEPPPPSGSGAASART